MSLANFIWLVINDLLIARQVPVDLFAVLCMFNVYMYSVLSRSYLDTSIDGD